MRIARGSQGSSLSHQNRGIQPQEEEEEEEEEGKVKEGMPGTKNHGSSHGLSLSAWCLPGAEKLSCEFETSM